MDRIQLEELIIETNIGVEEAERRQKQPVALDIVLFLDLTAAAGSDRIETTVSYSDVERDLVKHLHNKTFNLMENFAMEVIACCLSYPPVEKVTVRVWKPRRPILSKRGIIEMTRSRGE